MGEGGRVVGLAFGKRGGLALGAGGRRVDASWWPVLWARPGRVGLQLGSPSARPGAEARRDRFDSLF